MHHHEILYREVGQRVRALRSAAGLTQLTLGQRVGLTRTSITNIERGRQQFSLHILYDLADALAVSPTALLSPPPAEREAAIDERLPSDLSSDERRWIRRLVERSDTARG